MVNKLIGMGNEKKVEKEKNDDFKPSAFYESCLIKSMQEPEIIENENATLECPLENNEIVEDELMAKALNNNFVKVPEKACAVVVKKKAKVKHTENFVRATMSRSKSSKKLGKTMCPKKKFRYFTPAHVNAEESKKVVFSAGFHNKKRLELVDKFDILKEEFGHPSWREGQEASIDNVIAGKNTLTVLPTGTGKSLIYQLATRMLGGLCVVISPLISLITDQIIRLPTCLSAAALVSGLSYSQYHQIISAAKNGVLDLLFITPERFISESIHLISCIKLVCIDEAHCISKYSTSCRFSYKVLPKYLKGHQILALTGSIDLITQKDTEKLLRITSTIKHGKAFRDNLKVTVSREEDLLTFAGKIARSEKFRSGSIIIYCNLQYMADSVAQWLRSKGELCQSYHAGIGEFRRQQVQEDFTAGKIRILVATVSFGMGINKSNVAAVVHLHLPNSIEQFIQESGRAGRNGNQAHVHLIVNENTLFFQRSLIYGNHVTKRHILALGKSLFPTLKRKRDSEPSFSFIYLQIEPLVQDLGISKETLLEILNFFEAKNLVTNVSVSSLNVNITFHKTSPEELSKKYAIVSQILTTGKKLANCRRIYMPELCQKLDMGILETAKVLKRLAATGEINVEFTDEGFELTCISFPQELALLELAKETEEYFEHVEDVLRCKVETCFMTFDKVAKDSFQECKNVYSELSDLIEDYIAGQTEELPCEEVGDIETDVICIAGQVDGVPEAKDVCCIMQGINTGRTPYSRWKGFYLWGRYRRFRFMQLYKIVHRVLLDDVENKVGPGIQGEELIENSD